MILSDKEQAVEKEDQARTCLHHRYPFYAWLKWASVLYIPKLCFLIDKLIKPKLFLHAFMIINGKSQLKVERRY